MIKTPDYQPISIKNSSQDEAKTMVLDLAFDSRESGGISAVRIHALVRIAHEQPDLWDEIKILDSLKTVALSAELQSDEELPDVPVSHRETEIAEILASCPGIKSILSGTLEIWDKTHPLIYSAATYLRENALRLAQLSANNQRIHGLQFLETTPNIQCMGKALKILGITQRGAGRKLINGKRVWQYRVETPADVHAKNSCLLR
ncbi:MAG: hypothetical protein AAGF93_01705 [Cyanobacteria bacterium P01_H01_bin.105]